MALVASIAAAVGMLAESYGTWRLEGVLDAHREARESPLRLLDALDLPKGVARALEAWIREELASFGSVPVALPASTEAERRASAERLATRLVNLPDLETQRPVDFARDLMREVDRILPAAGVFPPAGVRRYLDALIDGQSALYDALLPFYPLARSESHDVFGTEWFTGCVGVIEEIDSAISQAGVSFVTVVAGSTSGKTALLTELSTRRDWPIFRCKITPSDGDFRSFLGAVAMSIDRVTAFETGIAWGPTGLAIPRLLESLATNPEEPTVLLVDDADVASSFGDGRLLGLPPTLPPGIVIVLAASAETPFLGLDPNRRTTVLLDDRPDAVADLDTYIKRRFIEQPALRARLADTKGSVDRLAGDIGSLVQGNWLYASLLLDDLAEGRRDLAEVADLPTGLANYYREWWSRWRSAHGPVVWSETALPLLNMVLAQREALTVGNLAEVCDMSQTLVEDLVRNEWGAHFAVVGELVTWRSDSHREVLDVETAGPFSDTFVAARSEAHSALAERGHAALLDRVGAHRRRWAVYGARHVVAHLVAAGDPEGAFEIVVNDPSGWAEAHALVNSGNNLLRDLERVWTVYASGTLHVVSCQLASMIRLKAAIHDAAAGMSPYLAVACLEAGLLEQHHVELLAEAVDDERQEAALRLLITPDTPEGRAGAVLIVEEAAQAMTDFDDGFGSFLPAVYVHSRIGALVDAIRQTTSGWDERWQGELARLVAEEWVLRDLEKTEPEACLDTLEHLGGGALRQAAKVLLMRLPYEVLTDPGASRSLEEHLPAGALEKRRADLENRAEALVVRVRSIESFRVEFDRLHACCEAGTSDADLHVAIDELLTTKKKGSVHQITFRPTLSLRDASPIERLADLEANFENNLQFAFYPSHREDAQTLAAAGPKLAGELATTICASLMRLKNDGNPFIHEWYISRSRTIGALLRWLPTEARRSAVCWLLDLAEEQAPMVRASIITTLVPRLERDELERALEQTTTAFGVGGSDLFAREIVSVGGAPSLLDYLSILSPPIRLEVLAAVPAASPELIERALLDLPPDLGEGAMQRLQRAVAAVIDPGGYHYDVLAEMGISEREPLAPMLQALRVQTLVPRLAPTQARDVAFRLAAAGKPLVAAQVLSALPNSSRAELIQLAGLHVRAGSWWASIEAICEAMDLDSGESDERISSVISDLDAALSRTDPPLLRAAATALLWWATGEDQIRVRIADALDSLFVPRTVDSVRGSEHLVEATERESDEDLSHAWRTLQVLLMVGYQRIPSNLIATLNMGTEGGGLWEVCGALPRLPAELAESIRLPAAQRMASLLVQLRRILMMNASEIEHEGPLGPVDDDQMAELREQGDTPNLNHMIDPVCHSIDERLGTLTDLARKFHGFRDEDGQIWLAALASLFGWRNLDGPLAEAGVEENAVRIAMAHWADGDEDESDALGPLMSWSDVAPGTLAQAWMETREGTASLFWSIDSNLMTLWLRDCPHTMIGVAPFRIIPEVSGLA